MTSLLGTLLVLAHHLSGPLALAFAAPPILVVGGAVLWLRRREAGADEEFDWAEDEDGFPIRGDRA
ncbi:unannotated protein [freshwater metagenome]|uniref:Unannotated protein n=1 Tax=freshwater metagenome TaxID=449393 RepID=A0A6J7JUB5_9ZZZZ|nr:hypothetical protein [Actinomycetota bacterium]